MAFWIKSKSHIVVTTGIVSFTARLSPNIGVTFSPTFCDVRFVLVQVEEACLQWCTSIQHLLDWLSDTEKILLTQSASPADVKQLEEQIEEQKVRST